MINILVKFEDGNMIQTRINATFEEAKAYYLGKEFNFNDTMIKCVEVLEA